ncbi:MAG: hypothetical protein ABSC37_03100 [Xanthobacteraceae bacterium]
MSLATVTQAAAYFMRRNRKSRVIVDNLTQWTPGLTVTAGQYVKSYGKAYRATNSGTTGTMAPTALQGDQSDGAIIWNANAQIFLESPPTP